MVKRVGGGNMLDAIHRSLGSIYRYLVVAIVAVLEYQLSNGVLDKTHLIMYGALFLYALAFSLSGLHKWNTYVELLCTFALIHFYHNETLYFLFLTPISGFVSVRTKWWDKILFPLLISSFFYTQYGDMMTFLLLSVGLYFSLSMFQVKFSQIEFLRNEIREEKGNTNKKRIDLSEKLRDLEVLNRMLEQIRRLNETSAIKELIDQLPYAVIQLFHANYAVLYLKKEDYYEKKADAGKNERHDIPLSFTLEEGRKPQMDFTMLRIPIFFEDQPWGVIAVYDKKGSIGAGKQKVFFPFEELDLDVLVLYLQQAMIKLSYAKLIQQMKNMALQDPLTGLANRRSFNESFQYLMERAARGETLTAMIIDIDYFKMFNDTYGHEVGDEVLKAVAETIKESVRKMDIVSRWGGEEFAVLLPNAAGNSEIIAERIRRNVKDISKARPITVSIGVAFYGIHGTEEKELLSNADKATYQAKVGGRDQVVIYGGEE